MTRLFARISCVFIAASYALGCSDSEPDAGSGDGGHAACTAKTIVVAGDANKSAADMTAALQKAFDMAASACTPGTLGPSGQPQGRVYLSGGVYKLTSVNVPSNLRIEIDPSSTIMPSARTPNNPCFQTPAFSLGDLNTEVRNVSFIASDGAGGPPRPSSANKPFLAKGTGFRGNAVDSGPDGYVGMPNEPISNDPHWSIETMWVLDMDPRSTGATPGSYGFLFANARDVELEGIFSIQNAERPASLSGTTDACPAGPMNSRAPVLYTKPPKGALLSSGKDQVPAPRRVRVHRHYNILSPSGYGPNQVEGCIDCRFEDIYSHGGVALRVETDSYEPASPKSGDDCGKTRPDGTGFQDNTFMTVDGLTAKSVEGSHGNAVVFLVPHCRTNGVVNVEHVVGHSVNFAVVAASPDPAVANGGSGSFAKASSVKDIRTDGAPGYQVPQPKLSSYSVEAKNPPDAAIAYRPRGDWGTWGIDIAGILCWPAALPSTAPAGALNLAVDHGACASWP